MSKKAVTLFEIIISTVIFVLVIAGLVNVFISSKSYIMHAQSRVIVSELSKYFLDSLQKDVRWDAESDSGPTNCLHDGVGCPTTSPSVNGIGYTRTYTYGHVNVGGVVLHRVIANITWNETTPT